MDDGAVNAFSVEMLEAVLSALDEAEQANAIVVIRGREGKFSAGFDLKTLGTKTNEMLGLGAKLAERLFSFPRPTVAVCTGHGIAMGGFVLMSCDIRVGVEGDFRIGLNEAAIGLTMPRFAVALAGHRLNPAWHDRSVITGELFGPADAKTAGFLDHVVPADQLDAVAEQAIEAMKNLNEDAHRETKLRARASALEGIRAGLEPADDGTW